MYVCITWLAVVQVCSCLGQQVTQERPQSNKSRATLWRRQPVARLTSAVERGILDARDLSICTQAMTSPVWSGDCWWNSKRAQPLGSLSVTKSQTADVIDSVIMLICCSFAAVFDLLCGKAYNMLGWRTQHFLFWVCENILQICVGHKTVLWIRNMLKFVLLKPRSESTMLPFI